MKRVAFEYEAMLKDEIKGWTQEDECREGRDIGRGGWGQRELIINFTVIIIDILARYVEKVFLI